MPVYVSVLHADSIVTNGNVHMFLQGGHQSLSILGAVLGLLVTLTAAAVLVVLAVLALRWWKRRRQMKLMRMDVIAM